jgi:hypothetical protein
LRQLKGYLELARVTSSPEQQRDAHYLVNGRVSESKSNAKRLLRLPVSLVAELPVSEIIA